MVWYNRLKRALRQENCIMIITTTESKRWQSGEHTDEKGIELKIVSEAQSVRGFGTCFSELGALALGRLEEKERCALLDELFSKEGCNFNYCRTPMGASDFSLDFFSYNESAGDYEMNNFSIERDRELLLPLIREGIRRNSDMQMFASPWCPPLWLKTKRAYSNGTFNMTRENLEAYALYFRKYVESYLAEKIPITHVCPQNEPCSNQIFPSCVWTGKELAEFVGGYLGKALAGTGVDIIFGTINGPETDGRMLYTRYSDYLGCAMRDERARKYIKAVAYQWAGKYALIETRDDYPELEIIQSESECGDGTNSWAHMMYIFELMRLYFRMGASAYVYWNIALEDDSASTWGWKQNSLIHVNCGKATLTPEFYLMKHFSHFVRRGAKYLRVSGEFSSSTVAFKNPDGQIVIVCANPYHEDTVVTVEGKSYRLPPRSVNTIVI